MESLRRGGGYEHIWRVSGSGGLTIEGHLEGLKELFPGVLTLVPNWFAIPDGAVTREGVAFEQHVRHESGEHVVGDWKLGAHRFFLGLFHVDNELGHTWVGLPHFVEAEDEFHPAGRSRSEPSFSRWSRIVLTGTPVQNVPGRSAP